jgi:hypothetical protein
MGFEAIESEVFSPCHEQVEWRIKITVEPVK